MDNGDNPFECGFDKYINLNSNINFLGRNSLIEIKNKGIKKRLMGVKIETKKINLTKEEKLLDKNNNLIGFLRSAAYSPKFKKVVGIAMIYKKYCEENQDFKIIHNNESSEGKICNLPII